MTTTERPLSFEVDHREGCLCEDRDAPDNPAVMWDERTMTEGLAGWVLDEIERRLRVQGRPLLRWRKNRWNDRGEQIGPELWVRSCEIEMLWRVMADVNAALDREVGPDGLNAKAGQR